VIGASEKQRLVLTLTFTNHHDTVGVKNGFSDLDDVI
jgi:hypothetical protein